jgi:hypothetical protein
MDPTVRGCLLQCAGELLGAAAHLLQCAGGTSNPAQAEPALSVVLDAAQRVIALAETSPPPTSPTPAARPR